MDLDRKNLRLPVESRVFIELDAPLAGSDGEGSIAVCKTLDVSATGMQISLEHELTENAYLQIGVESPHGDETADTFFLTVQVRWCRRGTTQDQPWLAGLALLPAENSDIGHWIELISELE